MLRFSLFGFPILIHWMFWLNTALMGGALNASSPGQLRGLLAWMTAVLLSLLIHELGHALTMRHFGDRRASIILYAFGGLAQGSRHLTRREDVMITSAGPGLQILAGLAVGWTITLWRPPSLWLHQMLDSFSVVSLFWALLNLVPILPLDGGRLLAAFLGGNQKRTVLKTSLVCAVLLALLAFQDRLWLGLQDGILTLLQVEVYTRVGGGIFALLVFGMLAFNSWKALRNEPEIPWMNAR